MFNNRIFEVHVLENVKKLKLIENLHLLNKLLNILSKQYKNSKKKF